MSGDRGPPDRTQSLDHLRDWASLQGIAWALAAVGVFALIFVSGKLVDPAASALEIVWLRYLGGLGTILFVIFAGGAAKISFRTRQAHVHLLRAIAGGGSGAAAIYAASNMPVADAAAIGLLDGIFTILLGVVFLREVFSARQWLASMVCLAGALIAIFGGAGPSEISTTQWVPAAIALGGAFLLALESILIKRLARSENPTTVLFYVNFFASILFSLLVVPSGIALTLTQALIFLCLGPIAIAAQACNIRAFRLADAAVIGPVRYTWIVFSACFGMILFGEPVSAAMILGSLVILSGGCWLALASGRNSGNKSFR